MTATSDAIVTQAAPFARGRLALTRVFRIAVWLLRVIRGLAFRWRRWRQRRQIRRHAAWGPRRVPRIAAPGTSKPFWIDFQAMERKGFIGRPFVRRRLARDMRALRHRLLNRMNAFRLEGDGQGTKRKSIVMVTSCWPGEGKTFAAVNLTLSLLLEDCINVLLVDGAVSRSRAENYFAIKAERGLADYLEDPGADISDYLWRAENAQLTIMPSGPNAAGNRELFRGERMAGFFHDVSTRYDNRMVIVDGPPLLTEGAAAVLANYADYIILVVQAGRTSQTAVEDALDLLSTHDNVSLVLNRCNEGDRLT